MGTPVSSGCACVDLPGGGQKTGIMVHHVEHGLATKIFFPDSFPFFFGIFLTSSRVFIADLVLKFFIFDFLKIIAALVESYEC